MFARAALILITLFWAAMNVLLWRAEYGERDPAGSFVPVELVWGKILTAPDSSSLNLSQNGRRIGFCEWKTSVGEEFAKYDEAPPEGMPNMTGKYQIEFGGNVRVPEVIKNLRFDCSLDLSTNLSWREFKLKIGMRPASWEIRSVAAEQAVRFKVNDGEDRFERVFRFSDLQNPDALLREFAGPAAYGLLGGLSLPVMPQSPQSLAAGVRWEARRGTLKIGHEAVPVYRLQTRLLDRYPIVIFASRVGEILRAELPGGIVLEHDQLGGSGRLAMIELIHLVKKFGDLVAVNDISLTVPRGEFFAVLGPNAAGKTTTLKILAGLMKPTSGSTRAGGFDLQTHPLEARRRMAYVPDFPFLYDKLTPWEFFRFTGQLFQMEDARIEASGRELMARFNLEPFVHKPIEGLSHGTRQRVAILSALLHDPEVFVIDEPMVGLDPQHARVVKDILKERSRAGMTVFVSTHQLSVAEEMADRIGIIHEGRLIAVGTRDELRRQSGNSGPLEDVFLALTATDDASRAK